ncbi:hypothetical protein [Streptomyces flaveus]|uniref:Uncharacterized protein n=1 Tax=Streptomyces flaveus TaxID=66370 RepID=A0A917RFF9_9ACTN|nr:hypothetical protein [Streptomyces flaveus]GGL03611.1 hypothetical protein GCM10010094_75630 [Streptomyces flaveus]
MTDQPHAIRIDITGALREISLGDTPRDQARTVSRALLDAPAVIRRLDHPDGAIVLIGGKNRDRHQPNLYASLLSHSLGGPVEDLHGPVVFASVTSTDHLVSLPDSALAEAQEICAKASPAPCRDTNEKGAS